MPNPSEVPGKPLCKCGHPIRQHHPETGCARGYFVADGERSGCTCLRDQAEAARARVERYPEFADDPLWDEHSK